MDVISDWLREVRRERNLTQAQLGDLVGRTKGNVSAWEKGAHAPSFEQLVTISRKTNIPLPAELSGAQLEARTLTMNESGPPVYAPTPVVYDSLEDLSEAAYTFIPRRIVRLAMGEGEPVIDEPSGPAIPYPRERLERKGVVPEQAAVVSTVGNSMFPFVLPGENVLIALNQRDVRRYNDLPWPERVFAVSLHGMLRLKILQMTPSGSLRISSVNNEEHPPETIDPEHAEAVRVIGRMVDRA